MGEWGLQMDRFPSILINIAKRCYAVLVTVNKFLSMVSQTAIGIMLVINLSIVFAGVVFRYVLNQPLGWVYEVAVFLMMWSAFVGSAALTRQKGHVALEFLVTKLPPRLESWIKVFIGLMMILFLCIIINFSLEMIAGLLKSRSPYLRLPMIWVYSSVPVGMGMILLQQIEMTINNFVDGFKSKTV